MFTRNPLLGEKCQSEEFVSDVVGLTKNIVRSEGKDIWLGRGAEINSIPLDAGMMHEIVVAVHPTILGSGIPIFKCVKQADMKLLDLIRYDNGLVQVRYELLS